MFTSKVSLVALATAWSLLVGSVVHADDGGIDQLIVQQQGGQPKDEPQKAPQPEQPQQPPQKQEPPKAPPPTPAPPSMQQGQGQSQQEQQAQQQGQQQGQSQQATGGKATSVSSAGASSDSSSAANASGNGSGNKTKTGNQAQTANGNGTGNGNGNGTGNGNGNGTGNGNGNGSSFSFDSHAKTLNAYPVQVGGAQSAPLFIGGIALYKLEEGCGPWPKLKKLKNGSRIAIVFGLWAQSQDFETMHGLFDGYEVGDAAIKRTIIKVPRKQKNGTIEMVEMVKYTGAEIWRTMETFGQSSGAGSAANYANEKAWGGGASLSMNMGVNRVAMVAFPCNYTPLEAEEEPVAPTKPTTVVPPVVVNSTAAPVPTPVPVAQTAPTVKVLATTGKSVVEKDAKPKTCGGKPIPEGSHCAFIPDKVEVVRCDQEGKVAGATCVK
jgi:hypothetical protein